MIHQSSESIKPHNELRAKIGIFWIHKNKIIGKARELDEGEENVPGILDSPDSHIDLWEQDPNFIIPFPELQGSEYQEVPRGRVVFSKKLHRAIVYMDKVLGCLRIIFYRYTGIKGRRYALSVGTPS